jgi:4-amino-4-deoxy-L-arabinose transferase-like glycosyltransferase
MRVAWCVAAGIFVLFLLLYLRGIDRRLANGDEAVYAELGRSMAEGGDWLTPRWQDKPVWNRPPASVWPIAIAMKLSAPRAQVVRLVAALEAAAVLVLLFFLGRSRHGLLHGMLAALLMGSSLLVLLYARSMVAEWMLLLGLLAALLCWEKSRQDPRWLLGWGLFLGLCLLTKQVVGAIPLLACLSDVLQRRRVAWRWMGWGCVVALGLWGGWLAVETVRFGPLFLYQHFIVNVFERSHLAMLEQTRPSYYLRMLWVLESPLVLLAGLGLGVAAWRRDFLPVLWGVGSLLVFSLSATRFNYYALLAYPALALGMATLLGQAGRLWLAIPVVLTWTLVHLGAPGGFVPRVSDDLDPSTLAEIMGNVSRPDDPLIMVGIHPYGPRFYSQRKTIQLVSPVGSNGGQISTVVLEADRVVAPDIAAYLAGLPRWFAILNVEDGRCLAALGTIFLVARTGHHMLTTNSAAPVR